MLLASLSSAAPAQQPSAGSSDKTPPAQAQTQNQSKPGANTPPPSDSNAFPQDESEKAATQAQQDNKDAAQPPSSGDQQQAPDSGAGNTNAFPEDTSRKAAADAEAKAKADAADPGSASGVSSSGDYDTHVNGRNAITPNVSMHHTHSGKDPLKEDIQVGTYYLQSGNLPGAYSRFQEATALHPESTDAIFGLAEAARRLHKNDEALSNYKLFLDIVPSGSKAKDARKALNSLEKAH